MASNERVGITLDVLPGTFAGVTAALGGFNELVAATSMFSKAIADSTSVVDAMTLTLGVALAGAAWESAKAFGELERGMKIVQAVSGQTSSQISILTEKANEFSVRYKLGIDDITAGLQTLGRAGLSNVNTQLDTMQAGLQAAKIQGMELNDALEKIVATTALLGGDLKSANFGQQAEKLTSQLLSTAMTAPIDMNDVVQTLSYSGGTAAAAGINIQNDDALYDYLGAISAFAQKGVKGSMAGTAMRAFFTKPASQDTSVLEAFNKLKMKPSDLWEDGGNAMRPVSEQIDIIHKQMEKLNMSTLDQIELWGKIVGPKMGQQMMKLNSDTIKATSREIRQTASATELANMTMDNFLSDLSTLEQQAQRSWRGYGETALAWISPVVKAISGLFNLLGADVGGIPIFQQFVKMGIIIVISQIIQKLGAVKNLFVGIVREIRNMWGSMSKTERTIEEEVAAEQKRLQALGLTKEQAQVLADTEGKVIGNLGTSNKVLAEFLAKLNQAVTLMSELATLSRATSMNMISNISSAQHNRLYNNGAKDMSKTAWFNQHQGNTGNLTKNEFAALSLRHGMNESDLLKIYDSRRFQTYAQNKQGSSYAFPTAVSLEKYLQENQKGLYDPKVNPIMGVVNNIKTDTGTIAQGIKSSSTSNKTQRPLINTSNEEQSIKTQPRKKSSRKAKKEREEAAQVAEEEKQTIKEKEQTEEQDKQVATEKKKTKNSASHVDKVHSQQKQIEAMMDREIQQNRERVNKLFGQESEQNGINQKTQQENSSIQRANQLLQNINFDLDKEYISRNQIYGLTQEYKAYLEQNIQSLKGTRTSQGYSGSFTNRNIQRRHGSGTAQTDAWALEANKTHIARYQSLKDRPITASVVSEQLNVEKNILKTSKENLAELMEKTEADRYLVLNAQEQLALKQAELAKIKAMGSAYKRPLALDRDISGQMMTGAVTNDGKAHKADSDQKTKNFNLKTGPQKQAIVEAEILELEKKLAKETRAFNAKFSEERQKIAYYESQIPQIEANIVALTKLDEQLQYELVSEKEAYIISVAQKFQRILNSYTAIIPELEKQKQKQATKIAEEEEVIAAKNIELKEILRASAAEGINATTIEAITGLTKDISASQEKIETMKRRILNADKKINATNEVIAAKTLEYAEILDLTNIKARERLAQMTTIPMRQSISPMGPAGSPLLLPPGHTPNWIYGSGSSAMTGLSKLNNMNSTLLLPQTAESFKKVDKNLSTVLATMPYYKPNFTMVGSTYQGGMGLGMHMGNILQLEQTAKTFQTSLNTAYAVTNKYSANIAAMSNVSGAGSFLQSASKTMNNYKAFATRDLSTAYQILTVREDMLAQERSLLASQAQQRLPAKKIAETEQRIAQLEQERKVALEQAVVYARSALSPMNQKTGKREYQDNMSTNYSSRVYGTYNRFSIPQGGLANMTAPPKSLSQLSWLEKPNALGNFKNALTGLPEKLRGFASALTTATTRTRVASGNGGFWSSMRTGFFAGNSRGIEGGGKFWNWMQMGMTGMVDWKNIRAANTGLSTLGKMGNIAGGALGSLGMMFGPAEVAMMGFSLAMQGIQAAQQKYKEELEKINSKLSEARENFEKAEEAFLEAYEKENDGKVTQDQKDEALLNLYANGQGDRDDNLDSYRARVYGALNQIEINTRKKAAKENDFWWGSQGGMQKGFWSHWDETWGWIFDNRNIAAKDELTEQIRLAQENARTTGESRTTQWTEESVETSEDLERKYQSYIGMGQGTTYQMDYTLSHYANWIEDMEDYTEQAKYSAALLDRDGGIDSTGVTGGAELERTFGDDIAKSYRQFEASLQNIPSTVKTQITDSINSDPEFYKSMQRQMFTFKDNKLQRIEGKEAKILEAIRHRVGNITAEQAKQTLILSTLSSIHDFVQNQIQPQLMANVESSMSAASTLGLTYTSGGYTGGSTDAVHQGVMIITAQLGSLIEQKTLENMSLMAQSTGINFGDLTALARASETGLTADLKGKGYTETDAGQAMSIMKTMEAMYSGTMMTKGMSQEDAYKYGQTKFEELFSTKNGFAPEIPDMLRTWEKWFVPTMAPYIEEKWAQNLQDTTGEASGPTDTGKDKDKSKDSSKDTANKKNWVNLAICNKKEIPKLNVNLFKKPPNFTILNRNFKLRDVNVNTADDAKSIQNAVKNSIIEIQNRSNPKIIQDDAAEYDPVNATEGNTLPTGTKKTE